jgi:hypothetical protein
VGASVSPCRALILTAPEGSVRLDAVHDALLIDLLTALVLRREELRGMALDTVGHVRLDFAPGQVKSQVNTTGPSVKSARGVPSGR